MIKLHQETYGRGRPLVMIHGWAMHSGIWRPFARQLAEHYRVICLDLPGHGRSETLSPYTLANISETLATAIAEPRVHLLGWSLGATVAIDMASRFPDRVATLTALAGNPCFVRTSDWPGVKAEVLQGFADNLTLDRQATLLRFLALQVMGGDNGKALLKPLKQAMQECPPAESSALREGLEILANSDLTGPLQRLECPVRFVLGDRDGLVPRQCAEHLRRLKPDIVVRILENAGHAPFLTHQRQIIDFLSGSL
ncbi:pimeloyl-ACP methyl ester esterase BioH [Methylomarinum sp. Ch1-1]|uniref:Pimeloyl-[acyl-carrier protein] methyl ester esterase n=1 Tax=Methylomarinum roseum TaxID=3067653 RepID=A0AAU7NZS1_9GAMM|nr:pimeloyl-ACP methyl ester esterase BioH [Methylomarinum sp. Ch1-1]MDP4521342.1 pimeloyl-ACP methyl ester esterase BioH [Methylomarinum sp. Ch1-1]